MAFGVPDYHNIVRPKYGGAKITDAAVLVAASAWTELISISGRGMLYGGYVCFSFVSTQIDSMVKIEFDGQMVASHSFGYMDKYNFNLPRACPMSLMKYDNTAFIYAVGFSYGLTFEEKLRVAYMEAHGTRPTVGCSLIYALL